MTRAGKALERWTEKAGRIFDEMTSARPAEFIYDDAPDALYFTGDKYFLYALPGFTVATAHVGKPDPARKSGLRRWIENANGTVARIDKGTWTTGSGLKKRLARLTTENGKTAFIRPKFLDALPRSALLYVSGPRDMVTAAIQDDAGKLVTIAGIMPMQCDPAYFTPDAPKA